MRAECQFAPSFLVSIQVSFFVGHVLNFTQVLGCWLWVTLIRDSLLDVRVLNISS